MQLGSWADSAAGGVQLFISPLVGEMLDRIGRKPFLAGAPMLVAISNTVFAAIPSVGTLFLSRLGMFTCMKSLRAAGDASLQDVYHEPKEFATANARMQLFQGVSAVAASPVGGYLSSFGLFVPQYFSSAVAALAAALVQLFHVETLG